MQLAAEEVEKQRKAAQKAEKTPLSLHAAVIQRERERTLAPPPPPPPPPTNLIARPTAPKPSKPMFAFSKTVPAERVTYDIGVRVSGRYTTGEMFDCENPATGNVGHYRFVGPVKHLTNTRGNLQYSVDDVSTAVQCNAKGDPTNHYFSFFVEVKPAPKITMVSDADAVCLKVRDDADDPSRWTRRIEQARASGDGRIRDDDDGNVIGLHLPHLCTFKEQRRRLSDKDVWEAFASVNLCCCIRRECRRRLCWVHGVDGLVQLSGGGQLCR